MTKLVVPSDSAGIKQCCANVYGSDAAKYLLGDSFHPGGLQLTEELSSLLALGPNTTVLDVAAGKGTTAHFLAETFGCHVIGIDLSEQNVLDARIETSARGLSNLVEFHLADAEALPFEAEEFDAIICECAFCTFPSKQTAAAEFARVLKPGGRVVDAIICECAFCTFPSKLTAAAEFARVLKPGGRVGISDITRDSMSLPDLDGFLAWIACIGDAQPLESYTRWFLDAGMSISTAEYRSHYLQEMVQGIRSKILMAEIMVGLKKLELPGLDFTQAKTFSKAAQDAIAANHLGYGIIVAVKEQAK